MGMKILKAGGTAVDAVEAAITVLEDTEITNAGFGSNLTMEGQVECDATVVDHLGRSGACGATGRKSQSNPIGHHYGTKMYASHQKPNSAGPCNTRNL